MLWGERRRRRTRPGPGDSGDAGDAGAPLRGDKQTVLLSGAAAVLYVLYVLYVLPRRVMARRRRAGGAGRTSPCRGVGQRPTNPPKLPNLQTSKLPNILCALCVLRVLCDSQNTLAVLRALARP